ncbi:MAG: glucokinase [Polyangiales bacterium]
MRVLVGDIGGTKTLLALARVEGARVTVEARERYDSPESPDLLSLVRRFCADHPCDGLTAAFGVAGPVRDNVCRTTNLPWVVDGDAIARDVGLRAARVLNDFEAAALGVPALGPDDLVPVQRGEADPSAPCAVIGAGTGLGEATLIPVDGGWRALPGEGGHVDFAPRDPREDGLLAYLRALHRRVSVERVVSGKGLPELYAYLRSLGRPESPAVAEELQCEDPGAVIGTHAVAGDDPLCVETIELFLGAFGSEAGNLALKVLSRGGVYLAGGIAPRLAPLLTVEDGPFLRGLRTKGRMSDLVAAMPVWIIIEPDLPLYGSALTAARALTP